jgi:hypothetical protein
MGIDNSIDTTRGRSVGFQFLGHLRRVSARALKQPLPSAFMWNSPERRRRVASRNFTIAIRQRLDRSQLAKPIHCFPEKHIVMHNYCLPI